MTAYKKAGNTVGAAMVSDGCMIKEDGSQILGEKNASGYQSYIYNSGGEIESHLL